MKQTGIIEDGTLTYQADGQELQVNVGAPAWFRWLETATSFTFRSESGHFTAHKVSAGNKRGESYWRATRRSNGRLHSFYLGKSAKLIQEHLDTAACLLASRASGSVVPLPVATSQIENVDPGPDLLLNTRISFPRLPIQYVSRSRLLTLLEQSARLPITLISAAAGSGKTTLLAEWARTTNRAVSWFSLEDEDNDPAHFLSYFSSTLEKHTGKLVRTDPLAGGRAWKETLVPLLNNLTHLLQQDTVVILDNIHLLTSEIAHTMLLFLLTHLPPRLHLILGTRIDPPFPLARLRMHNQISEIRTDELNFTRTEIEVFVQEMGLSLEEEALDLLEERTEGWIAGIQLLALALRGHVDAIGFLRISGSPHRFLLDYIGEDILAQQAPETHRFLLQTCLLDQLTGSLCDAVTNQTGGQEQLVTLWRANLFISELDNNDPTRVWYRYHPLFAEALRTRLQSKEADLVPELYRRASHWYEQQNWEEQACEYAFLAQDLPHVVVLMEKMIPNLIEQGKFSRLLQWLPRLSVQLIESSPLLWVVSTSLAIFQTDIQGDIKPVIEVLDKKLEQQMQAHAEDRESGWDDLQHLRTLLGVITMMSQGDIERATSLIGEPFIAPSHPENALARLILVVRRALLGATYGASGNQQGVEHILSENPESTFLKPVKERRTTNTMVSMDLAELYESQGQLRKLEQFYQACPDNESSLFCALVLAHHAALLYEWNRLAEAEAMVVRALAIGKSLAFRAPTVPIIISWTQIRILLARHDRDEAKRLLESPELDPSQFPVLGPAKIFIGAYHARLMLACGLWEEAEEWEGMRTLHFDDPFRARLLSGHYIPYVTLARILLARGRSQRSRLALAQAHALLERLDCAALDIGAHGWSIEVQMLTALVLQAQGKIKHALSALGELLSRTEAEGYLRLFVDEGQPMASLLAQIAPHTSASSRYLRRIEEAFAPPPHSTDEGKDVSDQRLLDPLSERERQVLALMATGCSNQSIADQLVISLHTVKLHVKHILAKFSVTNRTQAVAYARVLHLI